MGAKQSSAATKETATATADGTATAPASASAPAPLLPFGVILQGLSGSGVGAVRSAASLPIGRVLHVDERFLTTPPIYSSEWGSANHPDQGLGGGAKADRTVWWYGGRGGTSAVWQMAARRARAVVFVVDSTDRKRMARTPDSPPPQPDSFVENYMSNSVEKRAEIFATLRADMTAKETLHRLLQQHGARHKPVLVLATKQDQPGAIPPGEIAALLGLPSLVGVDWRLSGCNALTGEGIAEAMHWLTTIVNAPTNFDPERERERAEERAKWRAKRDAEIAAQHIQDKAGRTDTSTDADSDTQQPKETNEEDITTRASTPTPAPTPTPPAETNGEPAVAVGAVVTNSQPEGQRSATPTPIETSGEVELRAEVIEPGAESAEGAADDAPLDAPAALGAFDSLSSACVVLPPLLPPRPEPVEMERRKKHWYSRAKLVPKPSAHQSYSFAFERSWKLVGLQ